MKPALKRKWIAALKSGQYRQGRDNLHKDGRYCCLGVLCAVVQPKTWRALADGEELRKDALAMVGISTGQQNALIRMNDSERKSFAEIADYIEREI